MSTNTDKTRQEELHGAAEELSYWMFESSGRGEYVRADRKSLYPDEATLEIEKLVNQQVLAALDKVKSQRAILPTTCNHSPEECRCKRYYVVLVSDIEEIEKEYKV